MWSKYSSLFSSHHVNSHRTFACKFCALPLGQRFNCKGCWLSQSPLGHPPERKDQNAGWFSRICVLFNAAMVRTRTALTQTRGQESDPLGDREFSSTFQVFDSHRQVPAFVGACIHANHVCNHTPLWAFSTVISDFLVHLLSKNVSAKVSHWRK